MTYEEQWVEWARGVVPALKALQYKLHSDIIALTSRAFVEPTIEGRHAVAALLLEAFNDLRAVCNNTMYAMQIIEAGHRAAAQVSQMKVGDA